MKTNKPEALIRDSHHLGLINFLSGTDPNGPSFSARTEWGTACERGRGGKSGFRDVGPTVHEVGFDYNQSHNYETQ
ncbi:MAG: hypothetical protein ABSD29_20255 [Verrucomicrobiota bacterium]|jgi:hypothetical protein